MDGGTVSNGQFMPNSLDGSPVISSGSGDIILTPTPSGKKGGKKWLAAVVVALFVVAVVTGVANSSYVYYFANSTLDGMLAAYGYPFVEASNQMLENMRITINELYDAESAYYMAVSETRCVVDNGIDYECLDGVNSAKLTELQDNVADLSAVNTINVESMLMMIMADAEGINEIMNGAANG